MGMTKFSIRELLDIIRIGSPAEVDLDLAERVEKVLALHKPRQLENHADVLICSTCVIDEIEAPEEWPCPTMRALEGD